MNIDINSFLLSLGRERVGGRVKMKYFPLLFTLLDKVHYSALLSKMGSI